MKMTINTTINMSIVNTTIVIVVTVASPRLLLQCRANSPHMELVRHRVYSQLPGGTPDSFQISRMRCDCWAFYSNTTNVEVQPSGPGHTVS